MNQDYNDTFTTYDLGLASALVSLGFELKDLDKTNPRKVLFVFVSSYGIEQAAEDYWSSQLQVSARLLFDNTKMLKNRIYSQ